MEDSLLFDMVGVFVGFAGVMLILSLLVVILVRLIPKSGGSSDGDNERKQRLYTVVVALAVAGIFQVSTPKLLEELSTDRVAQAETFKFSLGPLAKVSDSGALVVDQQKIVSTSLKKFKKTHADVQPIQGLTVKGRGTQAFSEWQVAEMIKIAVQDEDADLAEAMRVEFLLVVEQERYWSDKELVRYQYKSKEALARINMGIWSRGFEFYVEIPSQTKQKGALKRIVTLDFPFMNVQAENVLGVLFTALLLSVFAPMCRRRFQGNPPA